jgi:hypothetical protein
LLLEFEPVPDLAIGSRQVRRRLLLGELIVLMLTASIAAGCVVGALDAPPRRSPPMHRGPGGTYVPGDTTYHGSGGP